ncbi:MAG: hypothetical protein WC479_06635 [Candidatus Izemoplasmatales bacterium]|jgi:hypothetical protein|nr:hypothetical protein [Candidatus Izemoplasmatales bacterium]MDD3865826.1 hypothetical protein [Candidatus Izemoplasmatales bacterium]
MKINLTRMIPFLDKEELSLLVEKIKASETHEYEGIKLHSIVPFLEEEEVNKLFLEEFDKGGSYVSLAPFVGDELWPEIAKKFTAGETTNNIVPLFPFMDEVTLKDLYIKAEAGQIEGLDVIKFLPFISDEEVDRVFLERVKTQKEYKAFLPFVSADCLHQFAEAFCQGDAEIDIDVIYPFMTPEDIKKIFKHVIENQKD